MTSAVKAEEYFYAATLDKKEATTTWQPIRWSPEQRLQLRQIMLGHTAKENEYNVIEVETPSINELVKIPIAVLKIGEQRVVQMNLEFPEGPVKFKLIEGSGPVYIHGQYLPPDTNNDDTYVEAGEDDTIDEEELVEEEDEYGDAEEEQDPPSKRRKIVDEPKANNHSK